MRSTFVALASCAALCFSVTTAFAAEAEPVNDKCPFTKAAVKTSKTAEWHDMTVGFCCGNCKAKWSKMSDSEKAKTLAKVMGDPVNDKCPISKKEVDKDAGVVVFEGKTVGFCCPQCPKAWLELSDEEKREKLEAVTSS